MKNLSELQDDTVIIIEGAGKCGEDISMTKKKFVLDIFKFKFRGFLSIGVPDVQTFEWTEVFERAEENAHEDFAEYVAKEISDDDWEVLKKAAEIVNNAYAKNPIYDPGELVFVDIEENEI